MQRHVQPGHGFDPTVLQDGRIMFTLWDTPQLNVPPLDKHENTDDHRPDGTSHLGIVIVSFFSRSGIPLAYTRRVKGTMAPSSC